MNKADTGRYRTGQILFKDYEYRRYLGQGQYAWVYLVANKARERALKVFKTRIDWEDLNGKDEGRGVRSVIGIQSQYMMEIVDYGYTADNQACLLLEYVMGTLEDRIAKAGGKLPEKAACHYFTEMLKGLKDLERSGIIHRDIKPGNLFLFSNSIKIGDFGFTRFTSGASASMSGAYGTPAYSAPEVFDEKYSHAADRWSAAVCLYRMLAGAMPFKGETQLSVMKSVHDSEPDYKGVPEKLKPFLKTCFRKASKDRHPDVAAMAADFDAALAGTAGTVRLVSLRTEPMTVSKDDFRKVFGLNDKRKPLEYIQNQYRNGDGTISDLATGLMWQRSGSKEYMKRKKIPGYIDTLNKKPFAGFSDWRLPTIPELMSLLEPEKENGDLYIDPRFDNKQRWCWSSDGVAGSPGAGWFVGFGSGDVYWSGNDCGLYVRGVRSQTM